MIDYISLGFKAMPTRSNALQKFNSFIITTKPATPDISVASSLFDRTAFLLVCTAKFSWFSAYALLIVKSS